MRSAPGPQRCRLGLLLRRRRFDPASCTTRDRRGLARSTASLCLKRHEYPKGRPLSAEWGPRIGLDESVYYWMTEKQATQWERVRGGTTGGE